MTMTSSDTDKPTSTTALSAQDVTALRMAEDVTFHYYQGRSYLRCYLGRHIGGHRIYSPREQRAYPHTDDGMGQRYRDIDCGVSLYGYDAMDSPPWNRERAPHAACFASVGTYNEVLSTATGLLKAGDELSPEWTADNNTGTIREADLHADELRLRVSRGTRMMVFSLAYQICPDNSARMVRRNG